MVCGIGAAENALCMYNQELMSGEAAKERATTAYARVPSKSKLLASELPNMETCSSI